MLVAARRGYVRPHPGPLPEKRGNRRQRVGDGGVVWGGKISPTSPRPSPPFIQMVRLLRFDGR
jgi:hypothetical protein